MRTDSERRKLGTAKKNNIKGSWEPTRFVM